MTPSGNPQTGQRRRREISIAYRVDRHIRPRRPHADAPAGRMLMQMLGSFAEFEREMIRERTHAGLHEARVLPVRRILFWLVLSVAAEAQHGSQLGRQSLPGGGPSARPADQPGIL
jgi:hypothetical protein